MGAKQVSVQFESGHLNQHCESSMENAAPCQEKMSSVELNNAPLATQDR